MNSGQITSIVAAIFTIIATYVFYWFSFSNDAGTHFVNGIGFLKNALDLWLNPNTNANKYGLPLVFYFFFLVVFLLFIASPILQLLGIKTKYGPLIGCIMPLLIGAFILLYAFLGFAPVFINWLGMFGDLEPLIEGFFPLTLAVEGRYEFYGTYILVAAGIISLIAGLKGPGTF